jgi:2'-5' RNA ligase
VAETLKLYALFLTFSGEIEKVFSSLRADYPQYLENAVFPHLTLLNSFVPVFSLFKVDEKLEEVARRTPPFAISLREIKFFEGGNNVAYAEVEHRRPLRRLRADIVRSLEGLVQEWRNEGKYIERFRPHLTIWNRIPPAVFPEVKKKLSRHKIFYEGMITDFSLFMMENGNWQVNRVFKLQGAER